jgi:hypothetical protein
MKNLILLPGLILACVFLTGCFGLVVAHPRQKCTEQFCLGNRGVVSNSPAATPLTEANVLELWGQPDTKRNETNAVTVWQYRGKVGWTIVMPAYIFALPLPFPAGHNHVEFYFQDGIARKASRSVMVTTGVFIGIPGMVCAWEKEEDDKPDRMIFGSGFVEEHKPVPAERNYRWNFYSGRFVEEDQPVQAKP